MPDFCWGINFAFHNPNCVHISTPLNPIGLTNLFWQFRCWIHAFHKWICWGHVLAVIANRSIHPQSTHKHAHIAHWRWETPYHNRRTIQCVSRRKATGSTWWSDTNTIISPSTIKLKPSHIQFHPVRLAEPHGDIWLRSAFYSPC